MLFTAADVARLEFTEDGSRAIAYVVFVSHERPDGERHIGITVDVPLTVGPGETIAELRARAIETANALVRVDTAERPEDAHLRSEIQARVNNLLARTAERWPPRFAVRGARRSASSDTRSAM